MNKSLSLCLLILLPSCAAPWAMARSVVTAADAALSALPDDLGGEEWIEARAATDAALALGVRACDVWEREATPGHPPTGWQKWVSDALAASADVLAIVKAAGVEVPSFVSLALAGLVSLLPLLGGL